MTEKLSPDIVAAHIENLRVTIRDYQYQYYVLDDSAVSDTESGML